MGDIPPDAEVVARFPASHPFVKSLLGGLEGLEFPDTSDLTSAANEFIQAVGAR